jgi:hypothetical protein
MLSRIASLALITGMSLGAPARALADSAPVASQVQTVRAPAPAASQDASDYAQREAQDKQVAEYQGGSTVVVVMSGGAFIVLLFLLLLL